MTIADIINDNVLEEEKVKLNVLAFNLTTAPESSKRMIYFREQANSSFYNSVDISTGGFYKEVSLIINLEE